MQCKNASSFHTRQLNFPFSKRPNEVEYSEFYFDFNIVQLGFEATLTLYIVQIAQHSCHSVREIAPRFSLEVRLY